MRKVNRMNTHVLVVDDELDTLNLLRLILEINGYTVTTTLNSQEAMSLALETAPDVVLLDVMMPRLDGFEVCKMLRSDMATCDLPIIFVTAYEALDLEQRRVDAGADLVIYKPVDSDLLMRAITEVIHTRTRAAQA